MNKTYLVTSFCLMFCAGGMMATGLLMAIDRSIPTGWFVVACSPLVVLAGVWHYRFSRQPYPCD